MKPINKQLLILNIDLCPYMDIFTSGFLIYQIDNGHEFDVNGIYSALVIANKVLQDSRNDKAREYSIEVEEEDAIGGYKIYINKRIDGERETMFETDRMWQVPNYISQLLGKILMTTYDE